MIKQMFRFLAVPTLLLSTGHCLADAATNGATLKSPEQVQILAIDGEELPGSIFGSRSQTVPLKPGEHVVSVRYTQLFPLGADDHDILKSPPVAFRLNVESGKTYQFSVNAPKRYEAAKVFAKNPEIHLAETQSDQEFTGVTVRSMGQASLVDTIGKSFQSATTADDTPATGSTLTTLQGLWLKATPAERQAFAAWMVSQSSGK
ncbi:hypothetical protein EV700_2141 [Fluviicoccus keumensis]|uniref:DUF2057 domain-containing protein n=1 Tax=Fluviicoccus keumensis TaxID=1435465 RepID=A0A4Q7Z4K6_9GAMM|nr:DUF2057 family protein [Fluviicoccus keumensis]RZU45322.1 hypothetical protein EV700_2141 [Fluviicoccus keumensis]